MSRITHLLNRKADIKRKQRTRDGQGGFTETPTTASTAKGRRQAASTQERETADREDAVVTHIWYFERDADVRVRDIIDDGTVNYEVVGVEPDSLDDHLRVRTKEIQHG